MGIITLRIDDELERKLRLKAADKGLVRGNLSKSVEKAIEAWLRSESPAPGKGLTFTAHEGGKEVAREPSLKELSAKLKSKGIDPRQVQIHSSHPPEPVVRLGLRTKDPEE